MIEGLEKTREICRTQKTFWYGMLKKARDGEQTKWPEENIRARIDTLDYVIHEIGNELVKQSYNKSRLDLK